MVNEFGGPPRRIEPTTEQLNELFVTQDRSRPRIFNPRPKTYKELVKIDPQTAKVVTCAASLSKFLNLYYKIPSVAFLVGGVGSAALAGEVDGTHSVYRAHGDLDFLVPGLMIPAYNLAFKSFGGLEQIAQNIHRTKVPSDYGSHPDIVRSVGSMEPEVQVDLFVYEPKGSKAIFSGGSYDAFQFDLWEPGVDELADSKLRICNLYGYDFYINEDLIRTMKQLDAKAREKGQVDLERIR